jgi:5,10-methylenetetrahydrofolate reductase
METQASIASWAEQTFGPAESLARIAARANEEMAELLTAVTLEAPPEKLAEEAADVKIISYRLATRLRLDLDARLITWTADPLGADWHVTQANFALAKVIHYLSEGHRSLAGGVLVDCIGQLERFSRAVGMDLDEALEKKMEINRRRHWRLDGSGHGYHVPEGEVA